MSTPVLQLSNLRKTYRSVTAVEGISFAVNRGEIVGLLGPNGAGKTTAISMILGVLEPTSGSITIENYDLVKNRTQAIAHTNFAAVYAPLPGNLTVAENLQIFGMLYSVKNLKQRIEESIAQFDLTYFRDTKCGVLSSGEQTRVALAKAFLNAPTLLLLDEPTASLDPATARDIRKQVRTFASGNVGVLWTSHNMYEVQEVCDRVLFMSKGKILLEGNPKTLPQEYGKATLDDLFITVAREPLSLGSGPHAA